MLKNGEYRKFIDLEKTQRDVDAKPPSDVLTLIRAEILCYRNQIRQGLTCLLENDLVAEAESVSLTFGGEALTCLAQVLYERQNMEQFNRILSKYGKFINGAVLIEKCIQPSSSMKDYSLFLSAILRQSDQMKKMTKLENALKVPYFNLFI